MESKLDITYFIGFSAEMIFDPIVVFDFLMAVNITCIIHVKISWSTFSSGLAICKSTHIAYSTR